MSRYYLVVILLILLSAGNSHEQEIQLNALVNKNPVSVDEQFVYSVEITGSSQNLPNVDLPDFSDFMVVGGPSTSSSFQIINFKVSASKTYTVYLMPRKAGTFKIGEAKAVFKGKTYSSSTIDLKVNQQDAQTKPSQQAPSRKQDQQSNDLSDVVFLKVIPTKRTIYVNEEVGLSYKIYFRTNITGNEILKLPEAVGAWIEEYPTPQRPQIFNETINGLQYNVAEIKKVAIFPSKAAKLTVSSMDMLVDIMVRRQRTRDPFSVFDDFFSDPFGQVVKKKLSSGELELNVLALPETGKPGNFSGLVGNFNIQSSIDKETLPTNDALSYKVKISGTGLLRYLNQIPVEFSPDFEVYEPKINESINKKEDRISSTKEFEYILIPRVAGRQKIRSSSLSYFNPVDKKYYSLKIPEYNIEVTKGKDMAVGVGSGTVLSKEEVQLIGKDIRYIKEKLSDLRMIGEMPFHSWWFYLSFTLPTLLLGVAWMYRNHLEKMSTNISYARSRKAHKQARGRLNQARTAMKQGKTADFYAAISSSLIGYVSDKTNRPAAGLLRSDFLHLLQHAGVTENLQNNFLNCLDEADYCRFAPGDITSEQMNEFYKQTEKVFVELEKYF
jgi:hypothetical protein